MRQISTYTGMRAGVSRISVMALIGGIGLLGLALFLGKAPFMALFSPEALLMVFGGTLCATMISFKRHTLINAWQSLRIALLEDSLTPEDAMNYSMEVARFVREQGNLALQPLLGTIELPVLRKGLSLILDNCPEPFIRSSLGTEIEVTYREQVECARVLETAGGYAPTMGIIGAVIGLMHVVQSLQNPSALGQGVASAFCATLFGVAVANLFLLPLAAKLRQQARDDGFINTMLLEAVLGISQKQHPLVIEEKLCAYLGKDPHYAKPSQAYYDQTPIGLPRTSGKTTNAELTFLDDEYHHQLLRQ
ncbi:MAG: MotA/TolQ/ExbB proton channel family protein [Vampirovibrionales bacterium]|nr:MotA/TolQ/ExbB proton channel family protein [Vampirovibrionales bacterium]